MSQKTSVLIHSWRK